LPKGGGAIQSIGEKFSANPVTGTASMSVPIALSPGRSRFAPALRLSYDSGAGNGPYGFGWSLSLPLISRKTSKGLPRYCDDWESDDYTLFGSEDLVLVLRADGTPDHDETSAPGYTIDRYRPRIDSLFGRIERWTRKTDGDVHWRSLSGDNVLTIYGRDLGSRIADPENPSRIFSWLICESRDDRGNAILYDYKSEDGAGLDLSAPNEANRGLRADKRRTANRYLKTISYGNRKPLLTVAGLRPRFLADLPAAQVQSTEWMFKLVLDYGEHDVATPAPAEVAPWDVRPDPFSGYRSGFEVRTARLCRRFLMFHDIPDLPGGDPGYVGLVRSTDLTYLHDLEPADTRSPIYSFLQQVSHTGYRKRPDGSYVRRSLPPTEFEYSQPIVDPALHELDERELENLPIGIDGQQYRWIDLHGEGIPGVFSEQGSSWYYKRNVSPISEAPVAFGPLECVAERPAMSIAESHAQFMDLSGDGLPDLVALGGTDAGFYEHDLAEGWQEFRPFPAAVNRDLRDPNLRLIDLNGDGLPDILISDDDALIWHPSLAQSGFEEGRRVANPHSEELGPRLVFSDAHESIYLADCSGDGLADLLRIRNREVCYWPNLGYGRFGARIAMGNAPQFDRDEHFDHGRVRLGDIDGSGTTDIIYLHSEGVRLYFNQSGNGWSDAQELGIVPPSGSMVSTLVADLQGNGTACLLWSSPLPGDGRRPLHYVSLMGGAKPHLLVKMTNNLGAETSISYVTSTKFYLQDKRDGRPWLTRLPFPVHVVERIETLDRIAQNRFVTRYAYHHGFFDGPEREFRGFGVVEQWDTDDYSALAGDGALMPANNEHPGSRVAPILTKTWFHTGIWLGRKHVSDYFAGLLDAADKGEFYREPGLSDAQARTMLLGDSQLPPGLSTAEEREAARALKGTMLRKEVYALDGSAKEPHPYTVTEQNLNVRLEQRRFDNRFAVFSTHSSETITYHYERDPDDPRIQHQLTLEVDPLGNILKDATVGYGRRSPDASLPTAVDRAKQTVALVTYAEHDFTNTITDPSTFPDDHRLPLASELRSYELTGYAPGGPAGRFIAADFVVAAGSGLAHRFDSEIDFAAAPTNGRQRRLVERHRTLFRRSDMTGLLPLGELEPIALPGENYRLAFTPALVADAYQRGGSALMADPATILGAATGDGGGYVLSKVAKADGRFPASDADGLCWRPSGRVYLSPGTTDTPAAERAYARAHFWLPLRTRDSFFAPDNESETLTTYDGHDLLAVESRDALGNLVTVGERQANGSRDPAKPGNDYRVLRPARITDPNRNRAAVAFDALGFVVGSAVMGKAGENAGDSLDGFVADLDESNALAHLADPLAAPGAVLQRATTRAIYDLSAYQVTRGDPQPKPVRVYSLMRETHDSELSPGAPFGIRHEFSYSDGFGREIQKKMQAAPGPVAPGGPSLPVRWICTGWTIFNNKNKPVRQYEPLFTASHIFEFGKQAGVSPILFYDPADRVVATLHPNGTYEKAVFGAWRRESWDSCDTILGDPGSDPDIAGYTAAYFSGPSPPVWQSWHGARIGGALGPDEQAAAAAAALHAATPATTCFDALGRAVLTLLDNGPDPATAGQHAIFASRVRLDILGNQLEVRDSVTAAGDPLGRIVSLYKYDLIGTRIYQANMEAGARWMLEDATGKPIRGWDERDHQVRTVYDPLRRPIRSFVTNADPSKSGPEILTERLIYGEQHPDAETLNLRDTLYLHLDQVGCVSTEGNDFKGNALRAARRLTSGTLYRGVLDWTGVDSNLGALPSVATQPIDLAALAGALAPLLETDAYISASTFDALNRATAITTPHTAAMQPSVVRPTYNQSGLLERIDANLNGAASGGTAVWSAFVSGIYYNAKGQRERIAYGNGVVTSYEHDPLTAQLRRIVTRRDPVAFPQDCPQPPIPSWPGCQLQSLAYVYDPVGNVAHIGDEAQQAIFFANRRIEPSTDYRYDALYRLVEATGREQLGTGGTASAYGPDDSARMNQPQPGDGMAVAGYIESFVYDAVGNLLSQRHLGTNPANPGWSRSFTYAETSLIEDGSGGTSVKPSNRLSQSKVGTAGSPSAFAYDAHGNMIRMPHLGAGAAPNMHWTYRDQLARVDLAGGGTAYYVSDASGQRIRKVWEKSGSLVEERIYLGGFEIFRRRKGNKRLIRETLHINDGTRRVVLVETRTLDSAGKDPAPAQAIRYQLGNHLGSATLELDEQARIVSYEEYSPYGSTTYQAVRSQTETPRRYRFTGKERDEETGLYYYGARYFAPWLARWTASDPLGVDDGPNTYLYVHANPVNEIDATGKDGQPWWRFTEAGGQYPTGRYDMFDTHPGFDTGFAPANLVVNLVVTARNICTIPFNAVTEVASTPEMIMRAAGASEEDIGAMNFALMMTGVGEVAAVPQLTRGAAAVTEVKAAVTEVKAVSTIATEVKAATTVVAEVKTATAEIKAASTAVEEAKALAGPATKVKPLATAASEAKAVKAVPKISASAKAIKGAAKPQIGEALVGSSKSQMRRAAQKIIAADPEHELNFLLGPNKKFKSQLGLTEHFNLADRPDLVQMGHITSDKAGGVERLMLQGAWENQFNNVTVEMSHVGGVVLDQPAVSIGGIAVDLQTAKFWESIGWLKPGTVQNAPMILR
jgi:RHS repeat-associated protein